jgi:flavodoxin
MNALVVFYSRDGTTRKAAQAIADALKCGIEEIIDTRKRHGFIGYMRCGFEARFKKLTVLEETKKDPTTYDLIIIGTPIWASSVSSPVRTYIVRHKDCFRSVAFFCTAGSGGNGNAFAEMQSLCNKKPTSTLGLSTKQVSEGLYVKEVVEFVEQIT